jgi:hypothetical protein
MSRYSALVLLQLRKAGDTKAAFAHYITRMDVCEGRFIMTRVTILAGAAAAAILLGIAVLGAESRWDKSAEAAPQAVAAQSHSQQ